MLEKLQKYNKPWIVNLANFLFALFAATILVNNNLYNYYYYNLNQLPLLGFSIIGIFIATAIFVCKKQKSVYDYLWFIFALSIAFLYQYRADVVWHILGFYLYGYCISLLGMKMDQKYESNILYQLFRPLLYVSTVAKTKFASKINITEFNNLNWKTKFLAWLQNIKWSQVLLNGVISIIILAIIIPLLLASNPFFKDIITDLINWLSLRNLFEKFFEYNIILRAIVFACFVFLFPRSLILANNPDLSPFVIKPQVMAETIPDFTISTQLKDADKIQTTEEQTPKITDPNYLKAFAGVKKITQSNKISQDSIFKNWTLFIPKITMAITLLLFIVAQIKLYITPSDQLEKIDYNFARLNNELFFQLSIVALIILITLYFDLKKSVYSKWLSLVLLVQNIFLAAVAFNADIQYLQTGLTIKRLYGLSLIALVVSLIGIYLYTLYSNNKKTLYNIFASVCIIFILTGLINFESLTANNNWLNINDQTNASYQDNLAQNSTDAMAAAKKFNQTASLYNQFINEGKQPICIEFRDLQSYNTGIIWGIYSKYSEMNLSNFQNFNWREWSIYNELNKESIEFLKNTSSNSSKCVTGKAVCEQKYKTKCIGRKTSCKKDPEISTCIIYEPIDNVQTQSNTISSSSDTSSTPSISTYIPDPNPELNKIKLSYFEGIRFKQEYIIKNKIPENSKVHLVSTYEGFNASRDGGILGGTEITLSDTSGPIVLVLASYEPVNWLVNKTDGVNLAAVIISARSSSSSKTAISPKHNIPENTLLVELKNTENSLYASEKSILKYDLKATDDEWICTNQVDIRSDYDDLRTQAGLLQLTGKSYDSAFYQSKLDNLKIESDYVSELSIKKQKSGYCYEENINQPVPR